MDRINKTLDTIYERINELSGVDAFGWGYSLFKKTKAILGTLIAENKVLETSKSKPKKHKKDLTYRPIKDKTDKFWP